MPQPLSRRLALQKVASTAAAFSTAALLPQTTPGAASPAPTAFAGLKGRIRHSVCRWCYQKIPLETLCQSAKGFGIESIDLLGPSEWATARQFGLTCAMANGAGMGIEKGFNRPDLHDALVKSYEEVIPLVAQAGLRHLICFSGNRAGLDDEKGLENCARGLKRLMATAEQHNVTLVMELLNSKVNHRDYQCDKTPWGVELCKRIGSERFKLLYDIYHMQIMEGDIIASIQKYHPYIAHYHTGGVPGRAEIDETQELNYPAIMRAIVATGFKGHVAQEFIPRHDPLTSLQQAIQICDV